MSQNVHILRSLVNERLTAAAEEIFALVERTIVEYEEELCRSKEENQRKQQLLDSVLNRNTTQGVQTDFRPEPDVKQNILPKTPQIKEEPEDQRIKQEEEQLLEFTAVCVKSEEQSSLLQQRQSEHRELTQGEHCGGAGADISLGPHGHLHSETEEQTDNDEDWEPAARSSTAQMKTEADGDHCNQVQIKDTSTTAHNSGLFNIYKCGAESRVTVTEGHVSGTVLCCRHLTQKQEKKYMPLLDFRAQVADALIKVEKQAELNSRKRRRPSLEDAPAPHQAAPPPPTLQRTIAPSVDVRLDRFNHFPNHADKRGRCRLCKNGYTQSACLKCKVLLCYTKDKNCFLDYHTKK